MGVLGPGARHCIYVFAIGGVILLTAKLMMMIVELGAPAGLSALADLTSDTRPRRLSRVERWALDVAYPRKVIPERDEIVVAALDAPAVSAAVLAAEIDSAERVEQPPVPHKRRLAFSWDDGVSLPLPPRTVSARYRDEQKRRVYAELKSARYASRTHSSAAEEFNRRFSPSRLAEAQ